MVHAGNPRYLGAEVGSFEPCLKVENEKRAKDTAQ